MRYLTIDGMMSGTGIRDSVEGGYLRPSDVGLSEELQRRLSAWLRRYEDAHYAQYEDRLEVAKLDEEGQAICAEVEAELRDAKVDYFSSADMKLVLRSCTKGSS